MTIIASGPLRWASTMIAVGLAAALAGCATLDLGDFVDSDGQSSTSPGVVQSAEPEMTAAELAAGECFVGIWQMNNNSMSSLLSSLGLLASDSIDGISLLIAQADGTATVEHIGWTYVVNAPPNPMLQGQAPTTLTITNDSSLQATYVISESGTIELTEDGDGSSSTKEKTPRSLTCEGSRLVEKVENLGGEIVYDRRH